MLYIAIFCVTVIVSLRNRTAERRLFTFLRVGPPFVAVYSDVLRQVNSEFTQQDGRKETTAKRFSVTKVTGLLLVCLSGIHLTLLFCSSKKRSVKRNVKFGGRFFPNKIIVTLAHEVCRRLSSPVLLRKFTINVPTTGLLALETMGSFFQWLALLDDKNNVYVVGSTRRATRNCDDRFTHPSRANFSP